MIMKCVLNYTKEKYTHYIRLFSTKLPCDDDPAPKGTAHKRKKKPVCPKKTLEVLSLRFPLQELPPVDRKLGPGECLRPYTNPCPRNPRCDPYVLPVHPCREKPPPTAPQAEVWDELSSVARGALLVLSAIAGGLAILYLRSTSKAPPKPKCVQREDPPLRNPEDASGVPQDTKYLIVGGGTAAFSAFRTIKNLDPGAKILVVSEDIYRPYMRPPLSKEMLSNRPMERREPSFEFQPKNTQDNISIFFEPEEFFTKIKDFTSANDGITCITGWKIEKIDYVHKKAKVSEGPFIRYDKCLLATGSRAKELPAFNTEEVREKVSSLRTAYDLLEIEDVINCGAQTIAVIGGTCLACEIAVSLAGRGIDVIQIVEEDNILAKMLPTYLAESVTRRLEHAGVKVAKNMPINDAMVTLDNRLKLVTREQCVYVDHAIVALGSIANTCIAEKSGLETDCRNGGFVVNPEMEIRSDHYAAGDCASFFNPNTGRIRLESHEQAVLTGQIAGENMVGTTPKRSFIKKLSTFYSEVAPKVHLEVYGVVDSALPTVGVFLDESFLPLKDGEEELDEYRRGCVFYLKNKKVVGVVMWNLLYRSDIADMAISGITYEQINDVAKMFYMQYG